MQEDYLLRDDKSLLYDKRTLSRVKSELVEPLTLEIAEKYPGYPTMTLDEKRDTLLEDSFQCFGKGDYLYFWGSMGFYKWLETDNGGRAVMGNHNRVYSGYIFDGTWETRTTGERIESFNMTECDPSNPLFKSRNAYFFLKAHPDRNKLGFAYRVCLIAHIIEKTMLINDSVAQEFVLMGSIKGVTPEQISLNHAVLNGELSEYEGFSNFGEDYQPLLFAANQLLPRFEVKRRLDLDGLTSGWNISIRDDNPSSRFMQTVHTVIRNYSKAQRYEKANEGSVKSNREEYKKGAKYIWVNDFREKYKSKHGQYPSWKAVLNAMENKFRDTPKNANSLRVGFTNYKKDHPDLFEKKGR